MAKQQSNQEIADKAFSKNKELNEVFVTSDGYPFATENAANLHKNTSGKKGLKVVSFNRKEAAQDDQKNKTKNPVKLDRLKLDELRKLAESKGIRPEDNATKAEIIPGLEALEKTKINE